MLNKEDCFTLGHIAKKFGLEGEIGVVLDSDEPHKYRKLESILVEINHVLVPFFVTKIFVDGKGHAKVKLANVNTAEHADQLVGSSVYMPLSFLPPLKGKKFYYHEVVDFNVIDKNHGEIGVLKEVVDQSSQAVFRIISPKEEEILIPVIDEFIEKLDRPTKTLYVNAPEGLIELYLTSDDEVGDDAE